MLDKFKALFGKAEQGFVYVADVDDGPMKNAAAGATMRTVDRRPPWIVVDDSVEVIIVADWPGRLWKVEILDKAEEQPLSYARYTRAHAVRVLEEVPVSILFGAHGDAVCELLERAGRIELEDVARIGAAVHPRAGETYSRVWERWIGAEVPDSPHRGVDHSRTLAVPSDHRTRSPIGHGLTVLYAVLSDRAQVVAGDAAFVVNEDEADYEQDDASLAPEWAAAAQAFLHAAMAFGAPELLSDDEREVLTAAFQRAD
jgi:hypothetical protein